MLQVVSGSDDVLATPVEADSYVPPESSVVSPKVLAQVFEDKPLPFLTNADGSVDMGVYMEWLEATGAAALRAFEEFSDAEFPLTREAAVKVL